jgi:hypothetical protein
MVLKHMLIKVNVLYNCCSKSQNFSEHWVFLSICESGWLHVDCISLTLMFLSLSCNRPTNIIILVSA